MDDDRLYRCESLIDTISEMTKRNGPSAFPLLIQVGEETQINLGMSLRDWFAGQALANAHTRSKDCDAADAAFWAYELADAMLAARGR